MTVTTTPSATGTAPGPVPPAASRHATPGAPGVSGRRVVRSEWIKLWSTRSTIYILVAAVIALVGFGAFMAVGIIVADVPPGDGGTPDPLGGSLYGIGVAELIVAVLGVLAVTGEYASGMIRASLTAVPRRLPILAGKAVVVASTVVAVTLPALVAAFFAARAILATEGIDVSITTAGVPRALVGAALYLAAVALLGVGLGWLLRSTAGALASVFGLMYVLPLITLVLPAELAARVTPYLPNRAGAAVMQVTPSDLLAPWVGFGVFLGYAVLILAAAALVLRRRDT